MLKCLVLGGEGFIGSNLSQKLTEVGYQVRVFTRTSLLKYDNLQFIEVYEGDFSNHSDIERAIEGCQVIFHLISSTLPKSSNDDPIYDIKSNLVNTLKMLDLAVKYSVKKIIFTSSGGTVYGVPSEIPITENSLTNPICSYGINKLSIEKYLHLYHHLYNLDYCILRLANPYGQGQKLLSSQGVISIFIYKALCNHILEIWGDGTTTRDYIYIDDVVRSLVAAIDYNGKEKIFNIGSGQGITLNTLISQIEQILGYQIKCNYLDSRPLDVPINILNIDRAKYHLDWKPLISLPEGLELTVKAISLQLKI